MDSLGNYFSSISRGLLSVCVPIEDLGKIFAVISTLDGLTPMIMSQIYASIWKVTHKNFPKYQLSISSTFKNKSCTFQSWLYKIPFHHLNEIGDEREFHWSILFVVCILVRSHNCHFDCYSCNVKREKFSEYNSRRSRKDYLGTK